MVLFFIPIYHLLRFAWVKVLTDGRRNVGIVLWLWLVLSLVSFVVYILANLSLSTAWHWLTVVQNQHVQESQGFLRVGRDWINQCSLQEGTLFHRIAGCHRCQTLLRTICFDSETVTAGECGKTTPMWQNPAKPTKHNIRSKRVAFDVAPHKNVARNDVLGYSTK